MQSQTRGGGGGVGQEDCLTREAGKCSGGVIDRPSIAGWVASSGGSAVRIVVDSMTNNYFTHSSSGYLGIHEDNLVGTDT